MRFFKSFVAGLIGTGFIGLAAFFGWRLHQCLAGQFPQAEGHELVLAFNIPILVQAALCWGFIALKVANAPAK